MSSTEKPTLQVIISSFGAFILSLGNLSWIGHRPGRVASPTVAKMRVRQIGRHAAGIGPRHTLTTGER